MSTARRFDVAVIGGGAAGVAAALEAARLGASVALVEAERPGGSCVHFTCIPTSILLDAAEGFVRARELAVAGILNAGESFQLGRANDRYPVRRFTLAHEAFHIACGTGLAFRRDGFGEFYECSLADHFASHLLVPSGWLRRLDGAAAPLVARRCGVRLSAARRALARVRVINPV